MEKEKKKWKGMIFLLWKVNSLSVEDNKKIGMLRLYGQN